MTKNQTITIVGGSGFLGRYVVRRLANAGYTIRVLCRNPDDAKSLKVSGGLGQISLEAADLCKPESFSGKLSGSYAVINLVGILFESGRQNFTAVQAQGAEKLAQAAKAAGVERFIQMSALGVDKATDSQYARSKVLGERAVLAAFPDATILRPSVVFGAEDRFFNLFAWLATFSPALPLIGGGHTKFQPVYVDDVAQAVERCLQLPEAKGQIYELGGPDTLTFRQIMELILRVTGRKACLVKVPFWLAHLKGLAWEISPFTPMITRDQVRLLKTDNVVSANARGFADLGLQPMNVEAIVPEYLARFRKNGLMG